MLLWFLLDSSCAGFEFCWIQLLLWVQVVLDSSFAGFEFCWIQVLLDSTFAVF